MFKKWCAIPDKIRFLFVGGVNASISYIIFAIAVHFIGQEHYQLCVALQWAIICILYKRKLDKRVFKMLHHLGCKLYLQRSCA